MELDLKNRFYDIDLQDCCSGSNETSATSLAQNRCDICRELSECVVRPIELGWYCARCVGENDILKSVYKKKSGEEQLCVTSCFLCEVSFADFAQFKCHCRSKSHQQKLQERNKLVFPPTPLDFGGEQTLSSLESKLRHFLSADEFSRPASSIEQLPVIKLSDDFEAFARNEPSSFARHVHPGMPETDFLQLLDDLRRCTIFGLDTETAPQDVYPILNAVCPGPHLIQLAVSEQQEVKRVWLISTVPQRAFEIFHVERNDVLEDDEEVRFPRPNKHLSHPDGALAIRKKQRANLALRRLPLFLEQFFRRPDIAFAGFGIANDKDLLVQLFKEKAESFMHKKTLLYSSEVQQLSNYNKLIASRSSSLGGERGEIRCLLPMCEMAPQLDLGAMFSSSNLPVGIVQAAARVLRQRFPKAKHLTCSNWAPGGPSLFLRHDQLVYAVRDAVFPLFFLRHILHRVLSVSTQKTLFLPRCLSPLLLS